MDETDFAKWLKKDYLKAKKYFKKPNITHNLDNLKNEYQLDYDKLKLEVEKLGYHLELAKNIDNQSWKEIWSIGHFFVFYKDEKDL